MSKDEKWLEIVKEHYDQHHANGGFQVLFPSYRPDMSRALANHLGLKFYDYHVEQMQSLGWKAANISLEDTNQKLLHQSAKTGLVVHNIESLLATKTAFERRQWLTDFLAFDWPNPIVLPISIYQADTPEEHARVCDIELIPFAKESFIMRLAM